MKKVLTLLAVLAVVSCASATVRVFVTTSSAGFGLENNANHMIPTVSTVLADGTNLNTYDYYDAYGNPGPLRPGLYPPSASPSGTDVAPVAIADGDFAYVWLQFQSEPGGANINGLNIAVAEPGTSATYYLLNNKNTIGQKRWDGTATPPGYPEWHNNPQTFVAVTAYGISNLVGANANQLWSGSAAGRIALLGAIEAPADGSIYHLDVIQVNYANFPNPTMAGGVFQFVPEPTSLLLMGLAGLLIRRR